MGRRMLEVSCADLGIPNCDYAAHGEDAEQVVDDITEHLAKQHDTDIPTTYAFLRDYRPAVAAVPVPTSRPCSSAQWTRATVT